MTNNIDIDLGSIPHPKDCYPVPVGATIPAHTPAWIAGRWGAEWHPTGYGTPVKIRSTNDLHLTIYPIAAPPTTPTPDDSPIIITGTTRAGVDLGEEAFAMWVHDTQEWCVMTEHGGFFWFDSGQVADWLPVVVTATERGIWNERDKRNRVDADGYIWCWVGVWAIWGCATDNRGRFGSLNALREWYGDDYLTGFADDGDAPCEQ